MNARSRLTVPAVIAAIFLVLALVAAPATAAGLTATVSNPNINQGGYLTITGTADEISSVRVDITTDDHEEKNVWSQVYPVNADKSFSIQIDTLYIPPGEYNIKISPETYTGVRSGFDLSQKQYAIINAVEGVVTRTVAPTVAPTQAPVYATPVEYSMIGTGEVSPSFYHSVTKTISGAYGVIGIDDIYTIPATVIAGIAGVIASFIVNIIIHIPIVRSWKNQPYGYSSAYDRKSEREARKQQKMMEKAQKMGFSVTPSSSAYDSLSSSGDYDSLSPSVSDSYGGSSSGSSGLGAAGIAVGAAVAGAAVGAAAAGSSSSDSSPSDSSPSYNPEDGLLGLSDTEASILRPAVQMQAAAANHRTESEEKYAKLQEEESSRKEAEEQAAVDRRNAAEQRHSEENSTRKSDHESAVADHDKNFADTNASLDQMVRNAEENYQMTCRSADSSLENFKEEAAAKREDIASREDMITQDYCSTKIEQLTAKGKSYNYDELRAKFAERAAKETYGEKKELAAAVAAAEKSCEQQKVLALKNLEKEKGELESRRREAVSTYQKEHAAMLKQHEHEDSEALKRQLSELSSLDKQAELEAKEALSRQTALDKQKAAEFKSLDSEKAAADRERQKADANLAKYQAKVAKQQAKLDRLRSR